jgi:FkbM family methyltransferase
VGLPHFIAGHFRPKIIFPILRAIHRIPVLSKLVALYDPNTIAQNVNFTLPRKLHELRKTTYRLIIDLNDHIGYWTYIRAEPFEKSVYRLGKSLNLGEVDVILDIGANVGTAGIPICAENGCELIAVEASKSNASMLLENAAINGVRMRAHILALAAPRNANKFVRLFLRDGNKGANSLLENWAPSEASLTDEFVFSQTLDDILTDDETISRIKIVKIDVEGAEWAVVQGARRFLARNHAPILMEYRFDAMDERLAGEFRQLMEFMLETHEVCGLDSEGRQTEFDFHGSYENIMFTRRALSDQC